MSKQNRRPESFNRGGDDYIFSPYIGGGYLYIKNTKDGRSVTIDPQQTYSSNGYILKVTDKNGNTTIGADSNGNAEFSGNIKAKSLDLSDCSNKISTDYVSGLSTVATSGDYGDLVHTPDLTVYAIIIFAINLAFSSESARTLTISPFENVTQYGTNMEFKAFSFISSISSSLILASFDSLAAISALSAPTAPAPAPNKVSFTLSFQLFLSLLFFQNIRY